jgi:putative membrane protein
MIIIRWLVSAFAVILVTRIVPGLEVDSFITALLVALVLGFLNAVIRPILVILTLPITFLTLGLFVLVINAGLFLLAASFVPGFTVASFAAAFWGAIVFGLIGWAIQVVFNPKPK